MNTQKINYMIYRTIHYNYKAKLRLHIKKQTTVHVRATGVGQVPSPNNGAEFPPLSRPSDALDTRLLWEEEQLGHVQPVTAQTKEQGARQVGGWCWSS